MLQWILESAIPRNYSDVQIIERIMLVNFAAIHTSSNVRVAFSPTCSKRTRHAKMISVFQSIAHALLDLAAYPEYIQPLRQEIESIIAAEGWTKAAMGKMWKVDSFLRESQRVNGIGLSKSACMHLPCGQLISVPLRSLGDPQGAEKCHAQ